MSQIETIKELHNQGEYQQAIEGCQDLLAKEPNNDEAHFCLAHASSRLNQFELALKHANEAVKLSPKSDRYQQFKGQMLLATNQIDEALKAFKRSIKENPNLFYSYLAIGDIYVIKNESKKAKEHYHLALKVHQDGVPAIIKLSRLMLLEGNYAGAEDQLQEAELQFPEEPDLKLQMGIMRLEQGEQGFAELYFKKILEIEPQNYKAQAYLGISLLHSDPAKAAEIINGLYDQRIQMPELMVALGMLQESNNNHREAIRYLTAVSQSGLAYPSWLMTLARAYVGNSQPNSAMTVLGKILQRGDNSNALLMLGQIHQAHKNHTMAIKTFRRVSQDSKGYSQALLLQAECHYAQGNYAAVIEQLEPLLLENPDHSSAIKLKLNALSQLGEIDQALTLIDSISSKKQTDQFNQLMYLYAGLLLDEQQKYDQAWQHFSAIETKEPFEIELLSADEERVVQQFSSQTADSVFKFVFTDPATGHHDFVNWLSDNDITPLVDRFTNKARSDVFSDQWTIKMLDDLSEAQTHFLRKKYTKQLNQVIDHATQTVADIMPFTPLNLAIIKRVFPQAQVLVLTRNFADLRLHDRIFGSFQVHYLQFSKVTNQMVAMSPNVSLVDIDAWQNQEATTLKNIQNVFGSEVKPFTLTEAKLLDRMIFPFKHWKNYQQQLNE